jgi:2-keto-4-pentenoate hydratase/2-oxohepta-3-ene-1,7-dioic acid hydratase in catechol pathway
MKLAWYEEAGARRLGIVEGREIVAVDAPLRADRNSGVSLASPSAVIAAWEQLRPCIERAARNAPRIALDSVRLLAPVDPALILCSGENYWDHRDEKPAVQPKEPEFFIKAPAGVTGPYDPVERDTRVTRKLDYEVELAAVIGRPGRHIGAERALEHVFGYTIMNDCTARDRQVQMRPDGSCFYLVGPGKNFDTCAPCGPWIVTADEISNPQALQIRSLVNGELRQSNTTANMIWGCAELVAFFSRNLTLRSGWMVSTGTPGGTAWASDPELGGRPYARADVTRPDGYLSVGDVVRCEVEHIGHLENRVVAPSDGGGR